MSSLVGEQKMSRPTNSMIAYRTCFSSISHHGYKLDVLKSGMQKYLRRKKPGMMIWCAMEIFKFELWAESEKEKKMCKGVITNMLNRLIVMMDEELLFCEVERYLVLRKLIEKFEEDRKNGMKYLLYICQCLQDGKISRHASDIRAYWDYRFRFGDSKKWEDMEKIGGEVNDDYYMKMFIYNFKNDFDEMYYWMFKIFNAGKKSKKAVFRKKKEYIYKIWEMLFDLEFVKNPKYNKGLVKRLLEYKLDEFGKNKKRGERFMFLVNCIELVRGGPNRLFINEVFYNDLMEMYNGKKDERNALTVFWTNSCKYMQIDNYVIDMHTSQGRKMKKNRKDFALEGCVVVDEDRQFLRKEWRDYYINEKLENPVRAKAKKKVEEKKVEKKVEKLVFKKLKVVKELKKNKIIKKAEKKKVEKTDRAKIRAEKYKRIKKMRGKPCFDDLEKDLEKVGGIDTAKITLCAENTCGNKVMCFEYDGKIWKEGRKSMNYNRDYCVLDECKELFGLEKIGMKRVLTDFRIYKQDKSKKSWVDNWCLEYYKKDKEPIVYSVMDKIKPGLEIGKMKKELLCHSAGRKWLKEYVKIGVFRGIFRVSDFNGRNVLIKDENKLVSIDEGDIGKRLDILGGREKWLIKKLNKDKTIINEILAELFGTVGKVGFVVKKMKEYKFCDELCDEVLKNWKNLRKDLENEGVEFD